MKLLLIDDNQDITSLTSKFLKSKGFEIVIANDPNQGLELIRNERFDSILLDISMPVLSGIDILQSLKNEQILKDQKIIIFSAIDVSAQDNELLKEQGVKCCLKKPIQLSQLISAITA